MAFWTFEWRLQPWERFDRCSWFENHWARKYLLINCGFVIVSLNSAIFVPNIDDGSTVETWTSLVTSKFCAYLLNVSNVIDTMIFVEERKAKKNDSRMFGIGILLKRNLGVCWMQWSDKSIFDDLLTFQEL